MTISCNGSLPFFGFSMKWRPFPQSPPLWLHDLVEDLFLYLTPVYLVVGTLGNILSVIVFLRPAMKSLACRSRFILISIMDIIILYGCMFVTFLDFGNFLGFCDLEFVFMNVWIQSSLIMTDSWILVLVTLERTLAIFRPLSTWTSNENRKRCCSWINSTFIALPFICSFLCLPYLFRPIIEATILFRFYGIVSLINTFLSTAVPFVLILCLDMAILIKLYGSPLSGFKKENKNNKYITRKRRLALKKKVRSRPDSNNGADTDEEEVTKSKSAKKKKGKAGNSHVTASRKSARFRALQSIKIMLAVDTIAVLLNIPMILLVFLRTTNMSLVYAARFSVYTRHAINFFFYFISSQFRCETMTVLSRHFRRPVQSGVSTTSLSTVTSRVNM